MSILFDGLLPMINFETGYTGMALRWATNLRGPKQQIQDPRYLFLQNKFYFKWFKLKTRGHGPLE